MRGELTTPAYYSRGLMPNQGFADHSILVYYTVMLLVALLTDNSCGICLLQGRRPFP